MIDVHCHILPATDDGPKSWEITLQMCESAAKDGVTHIVATPHCNHRYPFDREQSQSKIDELRVRVPELEFSLGCEFTFSENNLESLMLDPERFTIGDTGYILVEANDGYMPKQIEDILNELLSMGLTPILAHPERNPLLRKRHDLLEEWIGLGCVSAITGNSLTGFWGADIKKIAEAMVKKGLVHCLVSDAHDTERRPPVLSEALNAATKLVGKERAHELVWKNPAAVVHGEPVPA